MAENEVETVRVTDKKNPTRGMLVMNKSDFEGQKDQYELYQDPGGVTMPNQPMGVDPLGRNTSGTYSKPTPSDIRYPDKDATEFENNHGAFVQKDAAHMRAAAGQPPLPGGVVMPDSDLELENGLPPESGEGEKPPPGSVPPLGGSMRETEGTKSLVSKGKDGKRQVIIGGLSEQDAHDWEGIKHDREKAAQWISQKRALSRARNPLPTEEEVIKAGGGVRPDQGPGSPARPTPAPAQPRPAGSPQPSPATPGGPPRPPQP